MESSDSRTAGGAGGGLTRWLPLVVIAGLMVLVFAMGWHKLLSFKTIGLNYDVMKAFIAKNLLAAVALYILAYIAVVSLSLPGGLVMTLTGGLLFGWQLGAPATVVGATIGATIIFLIAKTSFGEGLAAKAGPWIGKLKDGFKENALSYLLFLRLVPAFPFVVVNLAPALLGVPLRTYMIGTFFGMMPGTTAFSIAGAGLGSVVEAQNVAYKACLAKNPSAGDAFCPYTIDTSKLVTTELLIAFAALGFVALIPVAVKKWSNRNAAA
ncbi:MAG: TVP38/TMEM64 family protein [Hyphomicrobium sp.]|nr:MAG: TVP38/TMEM64 family protein [Hyphomicrobium sp.]